MIMVLRLSILVTLVATAMAVGELTMWTASPSAVTGSSCEYANSAATSGGSTPWLDLYVNPGMYCAVSGDLYDSGVGCGKCYVISYDASDPNTEGTTSSGSAMIQVVDSGAGGSEHFDCFITAFAAITTASTGIYDIGPVGSYSQVDCNSSGSYVVIMDGNNAFYTKVLFAGGTTGVSGATIRIGSSSFTMFKVSGATWASNLSGQTGETVEFDITYADGSTITVSSCFSGAWPVSTGTVCSTSSSPTPGSPTAPTSPGSPTAPTSSSTPSPTPVPTAPSTCGCFPETATVEVLGKGPTAMKDINVGDLVDTGSKDGSAYQPIYAFGHVEPDLMASFVQIETTSSKVGSLAPLDISPEHLIFLEGRKSPVRADSIKAGDILVAGSTRATVTKVRTVQKKGLYAPLTAQGSVLVNGIKVSSYISLQNAPEYVELQGGVHLLGWHDMVHMFLSPFRMLCAMEGAIADSFCHSYNENGMPHFVAYSVSLTHWLDSLHLNIALQLLLMLVVVTLMGALLVFESLFGASLAPLVLAGGVGLLALFKFSKFG